MPARCSHGKCGTFVKIGELFCKAHKPVVSEEVQVTEPSVMTEEPVVVSRPELSQEGSIINKVSNIVKSLFNKIKGK